MTVGTRWVYSYSTWVSSQVYIQSEETAAATYLSMFLTVYSYTATNAIKAKIAECAALAIDSWISNYSSATSMYLYVRKYAYGNTSYISDFAYVWQGYYANYIKAKVIKYDAKILV